jgi:FkbH-like protein
MTDTLVERPPIPSPGLTAWRRLRELKTSGNLVANYPEIPGLLAEMDDEQLRRAGHILSALDVGEIASRHQQFTTARVFITGNFTLSSIVESLTVEMARHGLLLNVQISGYDQYLFDFSDTGSRLYASLPDLTCCLLDAHIVFDQLPEPWNAADIEEQLNVVVQRIRYIVDQLHRHGTGTLVLNTIPLPRLFASQLRDYQSRMRVGAVWRDCNAQILRIGNECNRTIVIDTDMLLTDSVRLEDRRNSIYAKAHFSDDLLASYAREVTHVFRAVSGRSKKCLVLDLDGTLWGGVLGENGPEELGLGGTGQGAAFTHFQRVIRQIAAQGVLLAVCSKNEESAVLGILRDHPEMILRDSDFVAIRANWRPKNCNLTEIAEQLNLSTDSLVFVDDNSFECGLVRRTLPDLQVVQVDDEPAFHAEQLLKDGWFTTPGLTEEDYRRNKAYRSEAQRQACASKFSSIDDYLRELETVVDLFIPSEAALPRIAQLTQRTNQFNLTTMRMSAGEVRHYAEQCGHLVLGVHSSDKFGDNGLVGALFTRTDDQVLVIDNMLLSCRVFSRGIETATLAAVLDYARKKSLHGVCGCYRETKKNNRFADFFVRHGFVYRNIREGLQQYFHDLNELSEPVRHIKLSVAFERHTQ